VIGLPPYLSRMWYVEPAHTLQALKQPRSRWKQVPTHCRLRDLTGAQIAAVFTCENLATIHPAQHIIKKNWSIRFERFGLAYEHAASWLPCDATAVGRPWRRGCKGLHHCHAPPRYEWGGRGAEAAKACTIAMPPPGMNGLKGEVQDIHVTWLPLCAYLCPEQLQPA